MEKKNAYQKELSEAVASVFGHLDPETRAGILGFVKLHTLTSWKNGLAASKKRAAK